MAWQAATLRHDVMHIKRSSPRRRQGKLAIATTTPTVAVKALLLHATTVRGEQDYLRRREHRRWSFHMQPVGVYPNLKTEAVGKRRNSISLADVALSPAVPALRRDANLEGWPWSSTPSAATPMIRSPHKSTSLQSKRSTTVPTCMCTCCHQARVKMATVEGSTTGPSRDHVVSTPSQSVQDFYAEGSETHAPMLISGLTGNPRRQVLDGENRRMQFG
jgi:hypothetical protein